MLLLLPPPPPPLASHCLRVHLQPPERPRTGVRVWGTQAQLQAMPLEVVREIDMKILEERRFLRCVVRRAAVLAHAYYSQLHAHDTITTTATASSTTTFTTRETGGDRLSSHYC